MATQIDTHANRLMFTADEMGERLGVSGHTVLDWARQNRIPARRLTKRVVRFVCDDVMAALDAAT